MKLPASKFLLIIVIFLLQACATSKAPVADSTTFINGDALPDAPELALRGEYKVGVRTFTLVNKGQIDILNLKNGVAPLYDRPLTVEVWYPAVIPEGKTVLTTYHDTYGSSTDSSRLPLTHFTFKGRALRDAAPDKKAAPYPLVIVSHGYPGSRVLLSYLTENLASKGYVVVAIDHTESTHSDTKGFQSTLLNRAKDILFVLNQIGISGKSNSGDFLAGLVDADNTALIGYSMGGYGVLNAAGAGYSEKMEAMFAKMTGGSKAIDVRIAGNPDFISSMDKRIKAVVAFAPWGMQRGVWDAEGLKGLKVPTFFVAGSKDDVSGYEDGTKAIYESSVNANRYLLTYENARHNVAPNPPPAELFKPGSFADYYHYAEPAWDQRRINNINQHFVTAFLGVYIQHKDFSKYLSVADSTSSSKSWPGFKPRSFVGLQLLHQPAGE
ncbi:MAG: dienelactone hydrolase [Bacteroidota bacterium]|nr:dienelactone hydrolase [Bacteroidota bacterium]